MPQERPGERAIDEYELTGHYEHWHDDLALARDAGAELLRWGVPWYRINPEPGELGVELARPRRRPFRGAGLRPIVDLMHYGTPLWLEDQFLNASYPERVAAYSREVASRYAGVWDDFTP